MSNGDNTKLYVWPDDSWVSEEDVDDIEWHCESTGKSDDYLITQVPSELDAEDIEELIGLKALSGMSGTIAVKKLSIVGAGEIKLADGAFLIVKFDEENTYVTQSEGQTIFNGASVTYEVKRGKK